MTHTQLVKATLELLWSRGIAAWEVNAGVQFVGRGANKRMVRGAPPGTPDIIGYAADAESDSAKFFAIECKTGKGRLNKVQEAWKNSFQLSGGGYFVVRSEYHGNLNDEAWFSASQVAD